MPLDEPQPTPRLRRPSRPGEVTLSRETGKGRSYPSPSVASFPQPRWSSRHKKAATLCTQLRPLVSAAAEAGGVTSVVFRLLCRAVYEPKLDPEEQLRALRLARFAVDQLPPETGERPRLLGQRAPRHTPRRRSVGIGFRRPTLGPRVLVVDDEPATLRVTAAALLTAGYRVRCVPDCTEAREEVDRWQPVLVVVDMLEPGIVDGDGFALELLRREIPVVLLCSTKIEPFDPGIYFLPRSFVRAELLAAVERLLGGD